MKKTPRYICASVRKCLWNTFTCDKKKEKKKSMTRGPHSTVFIHNSHFTHKMTDSKNYKLHKYCNKYIHLQYRSILMTSSFTSQTLLVFSNKNHHIVSSYKNTTNITSHAEYCWVLLCDQLRGDRPVFLINGQCWSDLLLFGGRIYCSDIHIIHVR